MEEAERKRRLAEAEVHESTKDQAAALEEEERRRRISESEVHDSSRDEIAKLEESERRRRISESEVHESSKEEIQRLEEEERRRRLAQSGAKLERLHRAAADTLRAPLGHSIEDHLFNNATAARDSVLDELEETERNRRLAEDPKLPEVPTENPVKAKIAQMWKEEDERDPVTKTFKFSAVPLTDVVKWPLMATAAHLQAQFRSGIPEPAFPVDESINMKVAMWAGDLTRLAVDGIVNAANPSLLGGGGIDGAIHSAAGPKLLQECRLLGGCQRGECKITRGYDLPARYVLHTVGPVGQDAGLLQASYESTLNTANAHGLTSIGLCCVSTGVYGYPQVEAAHVALRTTRQWLQANPRSSLQLVVFSTFTDGDIKAYELLLGVYFPTEAQFVKEAAEKQNRIERRASNREAHRQHVQAFLGEEAEAPRSDPQPVEVPHPAEAPHARPAEAPQPKPREEPAVSPQPPTPRLAEDSSTFLYIGVGVLAAAAVGVAIWQRTRK